MTLLEVLLAVTMLALVSAALMNALAGIDQSQRRQQKQLAGMELANRLILTALDDDRKLPSQALPLEYGPFYFYYDTFEDIVRMRPAQRAAGDAENAFNRYRQITIAVYATDDDPKRPNRTGEIARLSRIYDPVAARNPDTIARLGTDTDRLLKLIEPLLNGGGTPSRPSSSNGRERGQNR